MRLEENKINQFPTNLANYQVIYYVVNKEKLLCVQILESTVKSHVNRYW